MDRYRILKHPEMKPVTAEEADLLWMDKIAKDGRGVLQPIALPVKPFNAKFEISEIRSMVENFDEQYVRTSELIDHMGHHLKYPITIRIRMKVEKSWDRYKILKHGSI